MAIIINNEADLISFIEMAIEEARSSQNELIAVPLRVDSLEEANEVMLKVKGFKPRQSASELPPDAVGQVLLNKARTVDDALDELESRCMVSVSCLDAAVESRAAEHVEGKTRRVETMFGGLIVDLARFGELSKLPVKCEEAIIYSAFLRQVEDHAYGYAKTMLVMVRGTAEKITVGANECSVGEIDAVITHLKARARSIFENWESYGVTGMQSGWDLFCHARFDEILACWRSGYFYSVFRVKEGGIRVSA